MASVHAFHGLTEDVGRGVPEHGLKMNKELGKDDSSLDYKSGVLFAHFRIVDQIISGILFARFRIVPAMSSYVITS